MNDSQCTEIAALVNKFSKGNGVHGSAIAGVNCIKFDTTIEKFSGVYHPSLCIIVQGKKRVLLENEIFQYQPSEFLVASVDLPVIGQIIEATKDKPYLCLQIELDLHELTELAIRVNRGRVSAKTIYPGIFIGDVDDSLADSVLRLVRLLETQRDIEVLSPIIKREIYYRLINGEYGIRIASITQIGSNMQRISAAIKILKTNFSNRVNMEELATEVGMSISSFYTHFKSVTAMTPLQYQKRLRLLEARKIMINERQDAASKAFQVGYESPSQFSREYARQFGNPPRRDVGSLSRILIINVL
ncbi:AraC family transcriptional regulator N-terminal domain-containing protein [Pseudoalteromonas mariniglutinosa]|uniref:AraC family transcriptional regulator N-terminal domain-containing protein n=1 Tax=Pseudoalteromonas mariniglutinosa TaxID=206042 RepID=UPI00384B71B6